MEEGNADAPPGRPASKRLVEQAAAAAKSMEDQTDGAKEALPQLLRPDAGRRLRIWSSACSSGEEPYSIAMTLHKALVRKGAWDARVLATDIDTKMVRTAAAGCYDAERARAIPGEHASLIRRQPDGMAEMSDVLKQRIAFRALNLLGAWPMQGKFDVVFCRNVIIYFDKDTQRTLFDRFADIITPGGYLFIGHSETLFDVSDTSLEEIQAELVGKVRTAAVARPKHRAAPRAVSWR